MARIRGLKVPGEDSFYHVISRTVGQECLLHDIEKQKLFDIIKRYSGLFFVKVIRDISLPVALFFRQPGVGLEVLYPVGL